MSKITKKHEAWPEGWKIPEEALEEEMSCGYFEWEKIARRLLEKEIGLGWLVFRLLGFRIRGNGVNMDFANCNLVYLVLNI